MDRDPAHDCPATETLLAFVAKRAAPSTRVCVEEHVADCAACRQVLSALSDPDFGPASSMRGYDLSGGAEAGSGLEGGSGAGGAAAGSGLEGGSGADARFEPTTEIAWDDSGSGPSSDEESPSDRAGLGGAADELPTGERIDRYKVLTRVGEGGMGTVYAAHDPELERTVALKLLRRGLGAGPERRQIEARLRREAQAMARLAHPNVATVYDVGSYAGRVFVTMEFVEGETLASWLRREKRSVRQVLEVFTAAGRGLSAAHEAGLVHRDFKPQNVLVGRDGRVRVVDFGLARALRRPGRPAAEASPPGGSLGGVSIAEGSGPDSQRPARASAEPAVPRSQRPSQLTQTGMVLGTPSYMAPEQYRGETADARSDQFAFCVALYEALYGERPFEGRSYGELREAVLAGRVRPAPRGARVPSRLRALLVRGLSVEPAARFASMGELLAELGRKPERRLRRGVLAAVAALLVAAVGGLMARRLADPPALCRGGERQIEPAWSGARRHAVEAALLRTGVPYAEAAAREVGRVLDGYAARWVEQHVEACEATRVRGEQPEEVLGLRMACLGERRHELKALADRLAEADAEVARQAVRAVYQLSELEACADVRALTSPVRPPADATTRAQVDEVRAGLAGVRALRHAGLYREGLEAARPLAERAKRLRYRPLEAEALFLLGELADKRGEYDEAGRSLEQAGWAAEAGRHDELLARSLTKLIVVEGYRRARYDRVEPLERRVTAVIERLGEPGELEVALRLEVGSVDFERGRYAEAERGVGRALELLASKYGEADLRLAQPLLDLGWVAAHRSQVAKARAYFERALAIRRGHFGEDHPEVASALFAMADAQRAGREYAAAEASFRKAISVYERAVGPEHPTVSSGMHGLALVHVKQGRAAEAVELMRRAVALAEKNPGPDHPHTAVLLDGLAVALDARGEPAESLAVAERALGLLRKHFAEEHPRVAGALHSVGRARMKLGKPGEALEAVQKSHAIARRTMGDDYAAGETLRTLGEIYLRKGEPERAVEPLASALRSHAQYDEGPREAALTGSLLAKALWEAGSERERARTLAQEAHGYMQTDPTLAAECAELEGWMRKKSLL
ncbi:MAG TPA: serine/threonine-protein kinase [Polyangiaceae bacterium]|nr:serine/threonine-protein kinase [Polyangiaceae bacterium]